MVLRHRGYGVHIVCDGQNLEEFDVKVESDTTISCYVPSEEGKTFEIKWEDDLPSLRGLPGTVKTPVAKGLYFYMDGKMMAGSHSKYGEAGSCIGLSVGLHGIRPFQFTSIRTTDDDELASRNDLMHEHLGVIEVRIRRTLPNPVPTTTYISYDHPEPGFVHERSKKAGSHRVGLGAVQPSNLYTVRPTYIDTEPYVIFRFRYRSRDMLQAQGIIPAPPKPPSPARVKREREVDEDDDDDDKAIVVSDGDEDVEHLEHKLKLLQDRISRKKAKKNVSKVKREPATAGSSSGDIIDLT